MGDYPVWATPSWYDVEKAERLAKNEEVLERWKSKDSKNVPSEDKKEDGVILKWLHEYLEF